MPDLALVMGTIRRERGATPVMPLVNMFAEAAPTEPQKFALQSFPGLTATETTLGDGPVRAMLQAGGVLDGALVAVSGTSLYADGSVRGSVLGPGSASLAGNEIGVVAAAGGDAEFWDGATFSSIDFPDGRAVLKVFEQGGRFLFIPDGGQAWYWTAPYETEVDGLNFASAESEPDRLLDGLTVNSAVVLFGTETIEFWAPTGDDELPYVPVEGRVFHKGIRATGCAVRFDNTFAWVSGDNIVYRAGNVPERISDSGIEELIAASDECRVDAYFFEGHEFLKVQLDDHTVEFDAQTRQWAERKTGTDNFRGGPVVDGPLFGSTVDGAVYAMTDATDLGSYHEKSFCAWTPLNGGSVPISNVRLRTNPGQTTYQSGDYAEPVAELIQSRDGGQTFGVARERSLGAQGQYRKVVEWRALGIADAPGFFARFRVTDPIPWRVSGVAINEARGGRSR